MGCCLPPAAVSEPPDGHHKTTAAERSLESSARTHEVWLASYAFIVCGFPPPPNPFAQSLLADSNKELDARISRRKEADDREFKRIDDSVRGETETDKGVGRGAANRQAGRESVPRRVLLTFERHAAMNPGDGSTISCSEPSLGGSS